MRLWMVAPEGEVEGKGGASGGGGGRGGGAGGPLRQESGTVVVPSSSGMSSSSHRSVKSKVLRQIRAVGFRSEPQDWSKPKVSRLSLMCSDPFIGPLGLSVTQKQVLQKFKGERFDSQVIKSFLDSRGSEAKKHTLHIR